MEDMKVEPDFQSPTDELDTNLLKPTIWLPMAGPSPAALPPLPSQEPARGALSPTDVTLAMPVLPNNSGRESPTSPSHSHPDTLDVMSLVETSTQHEACTQNLLNNVPDRICLRLLSQNGSSPEEGLRLGALNSQNMSLSWMPSRC